MTSFEGIKSAAIDNNRAWKAMKPNLMLKMTFAKSEASTVTLIDLYYPYKSINDNKI